MRASFLTVILFAAFAVGLPSQPIEQRGESATLDEVTAADAPAGLTITPRSLASDAGDSSDASTVAVVLREAEPADNNYPAVSVDEHPWKFKVKARGRHLINMWSSGSVQFQTCFKATGFWSYDYAIACALRDTGGRVYTLSRKGCIEGTWEPSSLTHSKDETRYNADVQTHWNDIVNGDMNMHCRVTMSNSISWNRLKQLVQDVIDIIKTVGGIFAAVIVIF
ncbi:hypothetical protein NOF04DRAFT_4908 [Fusarium oxysporum II5]|uniref:Uncharacterized protein n=2 Tax=Fusarium oxysporum species complex TaxID=171631 RepID=X0KRC8_FUSO5|nr:uncharacterized protein FOIG_08366 [Fusarium odoratissimum NRRL 54006]EXL99314.1 hypothetical protein FOIG_08366 [Fusarium odoratissimum NRRL 54006]KAK2125371.1 hypothetical protein NOF04DRAFT_4908 [Fusarium oxysporum II5]TXC02194.1 hypothetical protein FocTR4_00015773 [Fusarium oxysporum f. sp. cubense]